MTISSGLQLPRVAGAFLASQADVQAHAALGDCGTHCTQALG